MKLSLYLDSTCVLKLIKQMPHLSHAFWLRFYFKRSQSFIIQKLQVTKASMTALNLFLTQYLIYITKPFLPLESSANEQLSYLR